MKNKKVKPTDRFVWLSVLAVFTLIAFTATASSAVASEVWFDPDPSSVLGCGDTVDVQILLTATEGVNGIDIWVEYDPGCANITKATAGDFPSVFLVTYQTGATHIIGATSDFSDKTGDLKIATLTIECLDCAGCSTPLDLTASSKLGNAAGGNPSATWNDGTFSCGAPESEVWFDPDPSSVPGCGEAVDVQILLTATEGVNGIDIWVEYDPGCANITKATAGDFPSVFLVTYQTGATHIIGATSDFSDKTGDLKIATLTIECQDCAGCSTPLDLTASSKLGNAAGGNPSATWIDGTFSCGPKECLGTCCNDDKCLDPFATGMNCTECIGMGGKWWKPNPDSACYDGKVPFDLCLDWCPQCCNALDDDTDESVDFPADKECTCGLDDSETEPQNPVPEVATFLLLGVGVLSLALLVLWRRRRA